MTHEDIDDEELLNILQFAGSEVEAIKNILENDVRERRESGEPDVDVDPAYLLGSVSQALYMLAPDEHTIDERQLHQRRMLEDCARDILRLKAAWLRRYPDLAEALANRQRRFPIIRGGKSYGETR
jgi:hypothetical protein